MGAVGIDGFGFVMATTREVPPYLVSRVAKTIGIAIYSLLRRYPHRHIGLT